MKEQKIEIAYRRYTEAAQLPEDEQSLLGSALEATRHAYAPFSEFLVGCALLTDSNEVFTGNNQENLAFPSGTCAERTALFYVGSSGKGGNIRKMAIRAKSVRIPVDTPVTPCGACRQVMAEYEKMGNHLWVVLMQGESGDILRIEGVIQSLLPLCFDAHLK